jgi:predicted neutral ceramidase superfamily lipid hydrolase
MGHLTSEQVRQVSRFLDQQGLTFEPLKNELLDHFLTDLENQMSQGHSFESSFNIITQQLVKHQILNIEQETMEAINNQSILTTRITYLALGLLLITSVFKLLHLPGATILLFSSVSAFTLALLAGAITGIRRYKDKFGAGMLYAVIGSIILYTFAWAFLILHYPGAKKLITGSVVALILSFAIATYRFAVDPRFANSILAYLHDKYSQGIEKVLLIVLATASLLKLSAIMMNYPPNVAIVLLVFVISGGVLHFFASQWHQPMTRPIAWMLIACFIIGELPALRILPLESRAFFASAFYILAGWIAVSRSNAGILQKITVSVTTIFYILFQLNTWQYVGQNIDSYLFSPIMLLLMISFLIIGWNQRLLKIYFITAIAHFILEFPTQVL